MRETVKGRERMKAEGGVGDYMGEIMLYFLC